MFRKRRSAAHHAQRLPLCSSGRSIKDTAKLTRARAVKGPRRGLDCATEAREGSGGGRGMKGWGLGIENAAA
eukprot:6207483-Pleurochrysis_carterae.AAC.1